MGDEMLKLLGRTRRNVDEAKDFFKKLATAHGGAEVFEHLDALYGAAIVGLTLLSEQRRWELSQDEALNRLELLEHGQWKPGAADDAES